MAAACNTSPKSPDNKTAPQNTNTQQSQNETSAAPVAKTFSMEEVAKANSKEKCLSVVNGKVYDLTGFIAKHPGGADAVLSLCGKDGTEAFTKQHGGMEKPEAQLNKLEIGILK